MAYTSADLAKIKAAIAKGEKSVQFSDRSVTYRSLDELRQAQAAIEAELYSRPRQTLIVSGKGF